MSTDQFVSALTECRLGPTEIAEIIWLALRQPQPESVDEPHRDFEDEEAAVEDRASNYTGNWENEPDDATGDPEDETKKEDTLYGLAPELPSEILSEKALPISVPDADILNETLPLVRAMKPLLKKVETQLLSTIDESKTVDRIAESDIWSPVLNPDQEPWFEVALVVDSSHSMDIWQRLIRDIQRLLRCYGSFRDFRVWQLSVISGEVGICAASAPTVEIRSPKALLTPDARRIILVFSDCTANYWWNGSLQPILALWGACAPTAVWQVLPDWMWKRTALGMGEYVAVRNHVPGAKNINLTPIPLSLRSAARRSSKRTCLDEPVLPNLSSSPICIPVVTSDEKSLESWSRMLSGDRRFSTPGFLLSNTNFQPAVSTQSEKANNFQPSEKLLETFRIRATPSARRLAALLSAAPVITLPVMRLIRASDELLLGSSPLPVAEVFLSGLLKEAPDQLDTNDPELVQYIFPDEVRNRLLDILPKVDAIEVVEAVSRYIAERLNCTLADFRALLLSPDLEDEADRYGLKTFAKMTAQILRKVGTFEFDQLVRQLSGISDSKEFDTLTDFAHDVSDAALDIQIEDLPIEFFSFTTANLVGRGASWEVERQQLSAERFTERISEEIALEMVSIPEGHCVVGSPEDEPGRFGRCESPQHEVAVKSFFMGRYPVTQAQWKVVATMTQVDRPLSPDPSLFKGSMLPVERVSWYDAIEFCARLSIHTELEYRLPTEAEWEYACRAGTITAFHFGDMIITEVANFNGKAYANGPKGKGSRRTTPVNQFGTANAYSLSDMHGNIYEWCQDHWHRNYVGAPSNGGAWLKGGDTSRRVARGGAWDFNPWYCRSAFRGHLIPSSRNSYVGFRVRCSAPVIPFD